MLVFEEKGNLDSLLKHYLKKASQTSKHIFLRENTQRTLLKQPSQKLLLKTEIQPSDKNKDKTKNLAFVMQHHPAVPNLKPILMNSWQFHYTATIA